MVDIARDEPGDRKQRDIRANRLTAKCDECGKGVHYKNLTALKDGRRLCPACYDALMTALFG